MTGKTFCIDIDGILCSLVADAEYTKAAPVPAVIDAVNALHARGNRIVLLTGRGSKTGIDWRKVTEMRLTQWGVHYDELHFGKPAADYYVDDKILSVADLLVMASESF